MKGCLMILALSGILCANSLSAIRPAKNYIYADNVFPNGDFSLSAGEYVIGSPVTGAGEQQGSRSSQNCEGQEAARVLHQVEQGYVHLDQDSPHHG